MEIARKNKQFCPALPKDLSKTFAGICYNMLIAKLYAYGFDKKLLKLIYNYLNGRSHKIKVGSSFSSELDIYCRQGSVLGPLLFNVDICDLSFVNISSNIENLADDTTAYECNQRSDNLITNL